MLVRDSIVYLHRGKKNKRIGKNCLRSIVLSQDLVEDGALRSRLEKKIKEDLYKARSYVDFKKKRTLNN